MIKNKINVAKTTRTLQLLNAVKLNILPETMLVRCYKAQQGRMWKVQPSGGTKELVWTHFEEADSISEKGAYRIPLKHHPKNAQRYYLQQIWAHFSGKDVLMTQNFLFEPQIWIKDKADPQKQRAYWLCFTLKVDCSDAQIPRLQINFSGRRQVSLISLGMGTFDIEKIRYVRYQNRVHRPSFLEERADIPLSECYPVLNPDMEGEDPKDWINRNANKYVHSFHEIKRFMETYLNCSDFRKRLGFNARSLDFMRANTELIGRVGDKNNYVKFGDHQELKEYNLLHEPLYKFGVYKRPPYASIRVMCIGTSSGIDAARDLLMSSLLVKVKQTTGVQPKMEEKCITFSLEHDYVQEVRDQLRELSTRNALPHFFIYISPYHKSNPDPVKLQLYYTIQEILREFNVPAMTIYAGNVFRKDLTLYIPNWVIKMIARLKGLPWIPFSEKNDSLVIGISAHKIKHSVNPYIAASCYYNEVEGMHDDDVFQFHSINHVADFLRKTIDRYCTKNSSYQRIVIHYHKELKKEESQALERVLEQTQTKLDVYVLHISKPGRDALLLFNKDKNGVEIPLHGTYYKNRVDDYYLFLNRNRKGAKKSKITGEAWPLRVRIQAVKTALPETLYSIALLSQLTRYSLMNYTSTLPGVLPATLKRTHRLAKNASKGKI